MMTWTVLRRTGGSAPALLLLLVATGCGALDVSDPTAIEDNELNNARGAALLRGDALGQFYRAFGQQALTTGLLTDEFQSIASATFPSADLGDDRRDLPPNHFAISGLYPRWPQLRWAATTALAKLLSFGPPAHAGEMLALRGHATLRLAEDMCPGFPSTELIDGKVIAGPPLTTNQAFERALADFDTALTSAADSTRVLDFARVGRAAALLGLGQFMAAAAAVAKVPTTYTWHAQYVRGGNSVERNPLLFIRATTTVPYTTIADQEGGNGLDFVSAGDPRIIARPNGRTDTGTPVYNPGKYANAGAPIVVVSGIEARLIEAESALALGNGAWLTILNNLRSTQVSPTLPLLADPGTAEARLDLLFRERAFWLFATGHRLGDLRRRMRLYGRAPESVFPTGAYHGGGVYGTATNLPFDPSIEGSFNPAVTGCTGS